MSDCALLFSEPDQQVHRLNESGGVVAARLQRGATLADLISELSSCGVGVDEARRWAADLLTHLAEIGLLEADLPGDLADPVQSRGVTIGEAGFRLTFSSEYLFRNLGDAYAHLADWNDPPASCYHLADAGEFVLLAKNGAQSAQVVPQTMAAVRLKGALLEDVLNGGSHLAALHAACVARGDKAFLMLGPPGAGKTTITLALLKRGFQYGSDDVTLVVRGGAVDTVPLPPAVKEGAWDMVEHLGFELSSLPVHLRPDQQRVRFLPLAGQALDPLDVSAIIRLNRQSDCEISLEPMSQEDALIALFEESRSASGSCSTETMDAFAQLVRGAECLQLNYSDAVNAARVLDGRYDRASHSADL